MSCSRANSALVRNSLFFHSEFRAASGRLERGFTFVIFTNVVILLDLFLNNLYFPEVFLETYNEINCLKLEIS